jgi:hypothetical protein
MSVCEVQKTGAIELYFYDESSASQRAAVEQHLTTCAECRRLLDDLRTIGAALAARPAVATPPGGDWTAFMARLGNAVQREPKPEIAAAAQLRPVRQYAGYLAMAAMIALVTFSVLFVATHRPAGVPADTTRAVAGGKPPVTTRVASTPGQSAAKEDAAFVALSERHFERSKLVVLGLTTKDPHEVSGREWAFERNMAASLLNDTRLYRMAAEQRGMTSLARVMGDLELVLLQTSMSETPDAATLEQLQRLIRKRDLVTKMEVVATGL